MSGLPARVAELGGRREQSVTDRDDRGRCDRLLEARATLLSPAGDERAVAESGDGDG